LEKWIVKKPAEYCIISIHHIGIVSLKDRLAYKKVYCRAESVEVKDYFFDDPLCPTCEKIKTIPTTDVMTIINYFIDTYRTTFFEEVRGFNKNNFGS
jgi:hypothetical protein